MSDEDEDLPPRFKKIRTKGERSKNLFRMDKQSVCGDKAKMTKSTARKVAAKHVGRSYLCPYCGMHHFSATEFTDYGKSYE